MYAFNKVFLGRRLVSLCPEEALGGGGGRPQPSSSASVEVEARVQSSQGTTWPLAHSQACSHSHLCTQLSSFTSQAGHGCGLVTGLLSHQWC